MSDKSGGFFSSVGRFFSGSKSSQKDSESSRSSSPVASGSSSSPRSASLVGSSFLKEIIAIDSQTESISPKKTSNSLRYLSPSVLDYTARKNKTLNGLEVDVEPVTDIFSNSVAPSTRKRQLVDADKSSLSQSFRSDSVKRSRFLPNRSLMEPSLVSTLAPSKLDTTWSGDFSAAHSPASSVAGFSLLSRRSGTTSNGSNLSSRTQQLLRKLNEAHTPARDVQRMTMIRTGLARPEKWATTSTNTKSDAPPLRKATDNVPSRIQLLSKTMAMSPQRKPYWRDLTRKRSESKSNEQEEAIIKTTSTNGSNTSVLSSIFTTEKTKKNEETSSTTTTKPRVVIKGSDGKSMGKNTFRLDDSEDLVPISESYLSKAKPLTFGTDASSAAPPVGFLGNLSFNFAAPQDMVSSIGKAKETKKEEDESSSADEKESEQSSDANDSSDSEDESSDSDGDEAAEVVPAKNTKKPEAEDSRPQTSTDTISAAASLVSSKNNSPHSESIKEKSVAPLPAPIVAAAPAAAQWTCDGCFTSWPASSNDCGCCGQAKGGASAASAPAQKQLVSNLSSFASSKPASSTVSFGFGGGAAAVPAPAVTAPSKPATTFGVPFGTTPAAKPEEKKALPTVPAVTVTAPPPTAAPATSAAPSGDRVAWDCPDCMVSNKATDDKCPCCGHVKYKSAGGAPTSAFGDKAFKPTPSTGTASLFGVGGGAVATTAKFGFGVSAPEKKVETSAPAPTPAASTISFGVAPTEVKKVEEAPKASMFGSTSAAPDSTVKSTPSMFGSGSGLGSLFGSSIPADPVSKGPAPVPAPLSTTTTTLDASKSMFGSSTSTTTVIEKKETPVFGSVGSMFGAKPAETQNLFGTTSTAPAMPTIPAIPAVATLPAAPATTSTSGNLFGTASTTGSVFGAKTEAAAASLFGKPFGSEVGTTSTDGAPSAKRMFSATTEAPKLSFGSSSTSDSAPKPFTFSAQPVAAPASTTSTGGLFGPTSTTTFPGFGSTAAPAPPAASTIPAFGSTGGSASLFGTPGTAPMFGTPAPAAAPVFGASSSIPGFGSTSAPAPAPAFGSFGSSNNLTVPSMQPTISNSSSSSSLFTQDNANPFQATTSGTSNGFAFGSSAPAPALNGGVYVFGSTAPAPLPTAQNGPGFAFGGGLAAPSGGGMENAFAYQPSSQSTGARKMATARRRAVRK